MLELSMIQSTTRSREAGAQPSEKATNKGSKEDIGQEFQNEYDAVEKPKENTVKPVDSPENGSEVAAGEDARTQEQAHPDAAATTEPDANEALTTDGDASLPEDSALPVADKADHRAALKAEPVLASVENRPSKNSEAAIVSSDENGRAKLGVADRSTEGVVVPAKTSPVVTKTTAETVVMTKAAENATSLALKTSIERSGSGDQVRTSAPGAAPSTVQAQNTSIPAANLLKVDAPNVQEGGRKKSPDDLPRGIELRRDASVQVPVQPNGVGAVTPNLSQRVAPTKLSGLREKPDIVSPVMTDLESIGISSGRPAEQVSNTGLNQVLHRAETPAMIARQMAEALQKLPDRPVEISLNPKELGRVRMNISAADAGITVNVIAERPETLDLMRRNIDQLTREFQALGYDTINFAFAEGEAKNSFGENSQEQAGGGVTHLEVLPEDDETNAPQRLMVATSGLDIRI